MLLTEPLFVRFYSILILSNSNDSKHKSFVEIFTAVTDVLINNGFTHTLFFGENPYFLSAEYAFESCYLNRSALRNQGFALCTKRESERMRCLFGFMQGVLRRVRNSNHLGHKEKNTLKREAIKRYTSE